MFYGHSNDVKCVSFLSGYHTECAPTNLLLAFLAALGSVTLKRMVCSSIQRSCLGRLLYFFFLLLPKQANMVRCRASPPDDGRRLTVRHSPSQSAVTARRCRRTGDARRSRSEVTPVRRSVRRPAGPSSHVTLSAGRRRAAAEVTWVLRVGVGSRVARSLAAAGASGTFHPGALCGPVGVGGAPPRLTQPHPSPPTSPSEVPLSTGAALVTAVAMRRQ